jgi:hypothetical protein
METYVWSHIALGIFGIEGQFPESRVKGGPTDISAMAEYDWCEWVKCCDTSVSFPDSKVQFGRVLGSAIDIGPATALKAPKASY